MSVSGAGQGPAGVSSNSSVEKQTKNTDVEDADNETVKDFEMALKKGKEEKVGKDEKKEEKGKKVDEEGRGKKEINDADSKIKKNVESKKDVIKNNDGEGKDKTDSTDDLYKSVYGSDLSGSQAKSDVATVKVAEVQSIDNKVLIDKIEKIVEKITVLAAKDVKSVNMKLNNNILPGTEVQITRVGGEIKIDFVTKSSEALNILSKGEHMLVDTLNKKFGDNVSVNIQMQDAESGDKDNDGKSRNEYVADEEDLDDDKE